MQAEAAPTHAQVSQALEAVHALAAELVARQVSLASRGADVDVKLLATRLKDEIDSVRALHFRAAVAGTR